MSHEKLSTSSPENIQAEKDLLEAWQSFQAGQLEEFGTIDRARQYLEDYYADILLEIQEESGLDLDEDDIENPFSGSTNHRVIVGWVKPNEKEDEVYVAGLVFIGSIRDEFGFSHTTYDEVPLTEYINDETPLVGDFTEADNLLVSKMLIEFEEARKMGILANLTFDARSIYDPREQIGKHVIDMSNPKTDN